MIYFMLNITIISNHYSNNNYKIYKKMYVTLISFLIQV